MGDTHIILTVAVLFPLFGLAVFFFWRWTYGVWAEERRGRRERATGSASDAGPEVVIVKFPSEPAPPVGVHPPPTTRPSSGSESERITPHDSAPPEDGPPVDGRRLLDVYTELRESGPQRRP